MAYQSHHCSATLICSACISVFLHASLALFVLLPFMLYAPCPFYALCLFCAFHLLHTTCFYSHESHSTTTTISSCSAHIYHAKSSARAYTQLFVLSGDHPESVLHQWSLSLDSSASLAVTVFNAFPSVNFLNDESSLHWKLPRDSSAPLAITLKLLEFSGRYNHSISNYNQSFLAVTERNSTRSFLWTLFPS
jgi:hypothetical protein